MTSTLSTPGVHDGVFTDLCRRIDELGNRLDALWHDAAASGDFVELERCTSAAQALRRAAVALRDESVIGV